MKSDKFTKELIQTTTHWVVSRAKCELHRCLRKSGEWNQHGVSIRANQYQVARRTIARLRRHGYSEMDVINEITNKRTGYNYLHRV